MFPDYLRRLLWKCYSNQRGWVATHRSRAAALQTTSESYPMTAGAWCWSRAPAHCHQWSLRLSISPQLFCKSWPRFLSGWRIKTSHGCLICAPWICISTVVNGDEDQCCSFAGLLLVCLFAFLLLIFFCVSYLFSLYIFSLFLGCFFTLLIYHAGQKPHFSTIH